MSALSVPRYLALALVEQGPCRRAQLVLRGDTYLSKPAHGVCPFCDLSDRLMSADDESGATPRVVPDSAT